MGITCKVTGKMKSILRKIENENEKVKQLAKTKKEKKDDK